MNFIKKIIPILNYIGNLLLLIAIFLPIVSFNNKSFAFIDQFFYLSFAVVLLVIINLVCTTLKKYRISLITTVINLVIIAYGIFDILNIERLQLLPDLSYGIALRLYPISIILSIISNIFSVVNSSKVKENSSDNKVIENSPTSMINDTGTNYDNNARDFNSNDQIPISTILNEDKSFNDNITDETVLDNIEDIPTTPISLNQEITTVVSENHNIFEINNEDNNNNSEISNNINNQSNTIDDDTNQDELKSIKVDIIAEDDNLLEEIDEIKDNIQTLNNNDIIMDDIIENSVIQPPEDLNKNFLDSEIPDLAVNDENLMINNTQVEDQPKQEFMALNPNDIKVEEKKPIFKKKEKKEEDPLEKLMKRNIPMTLGRTCQFCSTPLGDDERICPICGRIN